MEYHLADSLGFTLHRTYMRMRAISARRLRPYGLTPDQFAVLAILWDHPGLSQREVAQILIKDAANVTRIIDRLEDKGLLERRQDPTDRRAYRIYPSKSARTLRKTLGPRVLDIRAEVFQGLTKKEQDSMRKLLDKLFDSME